MAAGELAESHVAPESGTQPVIIEKRALRIQAPLVWRPAGLPVFTSAHREPGSIERVAAYSDARLRKGMWVEIHVFPREGASIEFVASVVRSTPLGSSFPARFDIEFEIQKIHPDAEVNLEHVLV